MRADASFETPPCILLMRKEYALRNIEQKKFFNNRYKKSFSILQGGFAYVMY